MPSFWSCVANREWKIAPLEADALGQARFRSAQLTASFAAITDGSDIGGDRRGNLQRLVEQVLRRHDARDEAGALGLRGIHHAAGQDQVHRLGLADRARQALGAADAGNDAELDFRLAEFGVVGGDDEVALHREFAAAAEREAGHRRDHRLARLRDAIPVGAEIVEEDVDECLVRHLLDVGAGGESLLRAGDDDAANRVIALERIDGRASSSINAALSALSACGRLSRIRPTLPCLSTTMF